MRVDLVGSLLRPASLTDAFIARGRSEIDHSELESLQDAAIIEVVKKQEALGLPVVTDGEFRRLNWQLSFSSIAGWDLWEKSWQMFLANPSMLMEGEKPGQRGADAVETFKVPATEKLALRENFPLKEYEFLQIHSNKTAKAMLMGPDRVSQMCDIGGSKPHYGNMQTFLNEVAAIQNNMVGELIEAGCQYVQLDEPSYTGYVDWATLERMALRGEDPMENLARAVTASNLVIEGYEGKACFGIHICRGNRSSMWHREGTYDGIAEYLFANLKFDRLLLEYDTERAGGFEPLRYMPKEGPLVVLGLITTKTGELEDIDSLITRIEEAQKYIDIDQLAISPQCGFGHNFLSEDEQWHKLEIMQEVAEKVWN